jgi:hypothetical protein
MHVGRKREESSLGTSKICEIFRYSSRAVQFPTAYTEQISKVMIKQKNEKSKLTMGPNKGESLKDEMK